MKKLLIISLLVVFCFNVFSQKKFTGGFSVIGQVADSVDLKGIPFATISIFKTSDQSIVTKLATSDNGKFETLLKDSGEYKIEAQSMGYRSFSTTFTIDKSMPSIDLGKILIKEAAVEIGDVKIIADKPLVVVEADKITYNTESDVETKTLNALDMLRKVPLVSVDGDDNVQLKGSSNFKIFLNGKPSTMISNNPKDFLKNFPASSIKNIEVITSPGAKYDAEGIGGIINLITQKATVNGYTCSLNSGINTQGGYSGGVYFATGIGKFAFSTNLSLYSGKREGHGTTYQENFLSTDRNFFQSISENKNENFFPYGNGEFSYEIDSLNLISSSFGFWGGNWNSTSNMISETKNNNLQLVESYSTFSNNKNSSNSPEFNIDYQKTFNKNKDQKFTLSYKLSSNPDKSEIESNIENIINFIPQHRFTSQKQNETEHTIQTDYVHPVNKIGNFETGIKFIYRINSNVSNGTIYNPTTSNFEVYPSAINDFEHNQSVYAGYFSYNFKKEKFGLKFGCRVEKSLTEGIFKTNNFTNFKNESLEFVPSGSISYQFTPTKSFQISYSKRIQRPGIWYLNPYVDNVNPKNISYGNPNLDPERFHSINLSFNSFGSIGSINLSGFYSFSNNGIDRFSTSDANGIISNTYNNYVKNQSFGGSAYLNLRFGKKLTVNVNTSLNYKIIESTADSQLSNEGLGGNLYSRIQYTIVKTFRVSINGGFYYPETSLQRESNVYYFGGVNLSNSFFKDKLTISAYARNLFWKEYVWLDKLNDPNFYRESKYYNPGRTFGLSISYRFGEMKSEIKKADRGISNDDIKKGEGGGNSGGGN